MLIIMHINNSCDYLMKNRVDHVRLQMKNRVNKAMLKFTTCGWIDYSYIDTLSKFINNKVELSRIVVRRNSYVLQLAKVLKYLYAQSGSTSNGARQEVHLSLPYHIHDVLKTPNNVESISNLKINLLDCLKILGLYLLLMLIVEKNSRVNRAYVIGVITVAMIYYKAVKRSGASTVHFHGYSYVPDAAAFVHIIANDESIKAHYYEYVSFVDDSLHVVTNYLHNTNEISSKYAKKFGEHYLACEYFYETSLAYLISIFNNKPKSRRRIGIYSAAFYCRVNHRMLDDETIKEGILKEGMMLSYLYQYALKRVDVEFVIYPHFARGVEPYEKAVIQYRDILKLENVLLADAHVKSNDEHSNIELGLTTISNVFWDRLYKGCKTILINPLIMEKFISNTSLANVSITTNSDTFEEQIDRFLDMASADYIKLLAE